MSAKLKGKSTNIKRVSGHPQYSSSDTSPIRFVTFLLKDIPSANVLEYRGGKIMGCNMLLQNLKSVTTLQMI